MKIEQGIYTVVEMCKILGENRNTFCSNQEGFYSHLNMFFECEFIPKAKGINIQVPEDSDDFEYMKWREAKKLNIKEKYAKSAEEHLNKNPYDSARNLARKEKDGVLKECNHTLKTGEKYFGDELNRSGNWNKHLSDKKWVYLDNGIQVELTHEEVEYLNESFSMFYKDQKDLICEIIQDSKAGLTTQKLSKQMQHVADSLYYGAMNRFKEKYGYQPYKVCRYDHEPYNKDDLILMQEKEMKRAVKKVEKKYKN